ncbi:MAG: BolA/IbaG family iron-sulfur metabolism protein [Halioglobus sp.]
MTVQQDIEARLSTEFTPQVLEVTNESHMHSVPLDSETHFRVVLVSDLFLDIRKVARHQHVYKLLKEQLDGPVHALALHTYTPGEWAARSAAAPASPDCLGGSKLDQSGEPAE